MKNLYVFAAFEERAFKLNDRFDGYCKWISLWYTLFVHIHPWKGIHVPLRSQSPIIQPCARVLWDNIQFGQWKMHVIVTQSPFGYYVNIQNSVTDQIPFLFDFDSLSQRRSVTVTIGTSVYYLFNKFNYSQ